MLEKIDLTKKMDKDEYQKRVHSLDSGSVNCSACADSLISR